jgi:hypothetical protein
MVLVTARLRNDKFVVIHMLFVAEDSTSARRFAKKAAITNAHKGGRMRKHVVVVFAIAAMVGRAMPAGAGMTTEQRLEALEGLIRAQQQEIKQLRGELQQQKAIGTATQQQAERAEEQAKTTEKKATAALPDWVNKFTPFGDIRVRHEGFYNQQTAKLDGAVVHAQNRERLRARLGVKYTYSDELSATMRLATGSSNNPISTNVTLGSEFTPKSINLDWAYITISPGKTFGMRPGLLTLNSGKFPNPMFRVGELVFDDDLAPEGFNQTVQMLETPVGSLDQVKLNLEEWNFQEVTNASDGWMLGAQLNPTGHVGDVLLEGGLGQYYWLNPDLIAQGSNTNSTLVLSNLVNTQTVSGKTTILGFQSNFNQTNLTLAATIPNVAGGTMPLKIFGDYVYNWQATNSHANGAMAGFRLGNPKEAGDWAGSLLYEYLQQEAVVGDFTNSDFNNGGTNLQGPVVTLDYQLFKPLTLTARSFFTKYIDPPDTLNNRTQIRLQLDAMIRF